MNKNINRTLILKITVILIFIVLFTGTAQAWSSLSLFGAEKNSVSEKLKELNLKKESLSENMRVMKFINSNMFDQGVDTVEISIKNDDRILETYYVVRGKNKGSSASIVKKLPDDTGILWKFKPTIDQALDGLNQASNGLHILEEKKKSKFKIFSAVTKALYLYFTVEKENVPTLNELITKSNCRKCKKALSWAGFL
ncbi:MAG: hypothetical protein PHH85_14675 [Candidatus Methanoperedens sp.]|nr:hypothetical protein [Candidatus Methanoperedens sp.]